MALTLSENFRFTAGGKAFRNFSITHDEATSTIYAASMDLEYIDGIIGQNTFYASSPADTEAYAYLTVAASHKSITISIPIKVGSVTTLTVVGW